MEAKTYRFIFIPRQEVSYKKQKDSEPQNVNTNNNVK